jgi:hypothetical protein
MAVRSREDGVNWLLLCFALLCVAYVATLLHEHGWLRPLFCEVFSFWRRRPRVEVFVFLALLCWAVKAGGSKPETNAFQGGQSELQAGAGNGAATNVVVATDGTNLTATVTNDVPATNVVAAVTKNPPPSVLLPGGGRMGGDVFNEPGVMVMGSSVWQSYSGPVWPFDGFTSNAIVGMAATFVPPIPDAMLTSGLALYRVTTNTALFTAGSNSVLLRGWARHGADNRGVWVDAPFPITLGTSTFSRVGVLANGRLAFGYATLHRQPTNDLPFETPYPVVTLAPLWGPFALLPSAGSVVWTRSVSTDSFVVCWENLLKDGDPANTATVQCEIRRDGLVRFLYGGLGDGAAVGGTAGFQNLGAGWT